MWILILLLQQYTTTDRCGIVYPYLVAYVWYVKVT